MAFNWPTFRTRSLTAAVFVVVMLTGLFWNQWSFFILFSIIHFGCWWEYQKIVSLIDSGYSKISTIHKYSIMIAGWCIMLYFTKNAYLIFDFPLWKIGEWMGIGFLFIAVISALSRPKSIVHSIFGLIYISLSLGLMMNLFYTDAFDLFREERGNHYSVELFDGFGILPVVIVFAIWINDTMAYIVGSVIGKTPLSKISPKKTWEGTVGGIILSVIVIGLLFSSHFPLYRFRGLFKEYPYPINHVYWYITAAIASVVGTFGDLLESKLKRLAGVKDSGHFMPGHGGFLDRFDSLLLAVPAVWLYVYFFLR